MSLSVAADFHTAEELLELSKTARTIRTSHRILAIRDALLGEEREALLRRYGISRDTLWRWIRRYNEKGAQGLEDVPPPGPACKLAEEERERFKKRIEDQPSYEVDGVVRWRGKDIQAMLEREYGVTYKTAGGVRKLCRRLGLSHLTTRPSHPKRDPEAAEAFKKNSPS